MTKLHLAGAFGVGLMVLVAAWWLLAAPADLGAPMADAAVTIGPALPAGLVVTGTASWYGPRFHGRLTASGVPFNRYALTAASRTLPHGTLVRVTNLANDRRVVLLINDWGPVPKDRVLDVSEAAADILGFRRQGLALVQVEVYSPAIHP